MKKTKADEGKNDVFLCFSIKIEFHVRKKIVIRKEIGKVEIDWHVMRLYYALYVRTKKEERKKILVHKNSHL